MARPQAAHKTESGKNRDRSNSINIETGGSTDGFEIQRVQGTSSFIPITTGAIEIKGRGDGEGDEAGGGESNHPGSSL